MYQIRIASQTDLVRIVEIYNQAVLLQNVTGDTIPFSVEARLDRFNQHNGGQYPIYVYENANGQVAGYLSLSL